jgi:hypothetical protein
MDAQFRVLTAAELEGVQGAGDGINAPHPIQLAKFEPVYYVGPWGDIYGYGETMQTIPWDSLH